MKRAIFVGLFSVLSYILYIFIIVFLLSKVSMIAESELLAAMIVIPNYEITDQAWNNLMDNVATLVNDKQNGGSGNKAAPIIFKTRLGFSKKSTEI